MAASSAARPQKHKPRVNIPLTLIDINGYIDHDASRCLTSTKKRLTILSKTEDMKITVSQVLCFTNCNISILLHSSHHKDTVGLKYVLRTDFYNPMLHFPISSENSFFVGALIARKTPLPNPSLVDRTGIEKKNATTIFDTSLQWVVNALKINPIKNLTIVARSTFISNDSQ